MFFMVQALADLSRNMVGWSTPEKIIVFESDDWGSIRMPSVEIRNKLIENGIPVDQNDFTRLDRLESFTDLDSLIDLLTHFKDESGRNPVITTLNIMGNPDFDGIMNANGQEYFWQPVASTYKEYGEDPDKMKTLWLNGIENGMILPQFHGREHLNVKRWMRGIAAGLPATVLGLNYRITGIQPKESGEERGEYQAAYDIDFPEDIPYVNNILNDGLDAFEKYFGFKSDLFVPTNGPLNQSCYPVLVKKGVRFINSGKLEREPLGNGKVKRHFRWLGKMDDSGLLFITRNCFFEPCQQGGGGDWVRYCINAIENAFKWNKPAVISSHRLNYIGGLSTSNRDIGLKMLNELFARILQKWPDVSFMSTPQLGQKILDSK